MSVALLSCATGCERWFNHNLVDAFRISHNDGSVEAMSSLFADDATFEFKDQPAVRGAEAIERLCQWFATTESQVAWEVLEHREGIVTIGAIEQRSRWLSLLGLDGVRYASGTEFVVDNGQIHAVRMAYLAPESHADVQRAMQEFRLWLQDERPDQAEVLLPLSADKYDAAYAQSWLRALEEFDAGRSGS